MKNIFKGMVEKVVLMLFFLGGIGANQIANANCTAFTTCNAAPSGPLSVECHGENFCDSYAGLGVSCDGEFTFCGSSS